MVLSRCVGVIVAMTVIATLLVHVRAETKRSQHRANAAQLKIAVAKRELWQKQMELAELRNPERIRVQVAALKLPVLPRQLEPDRPDLSRPLAARVPVDPRQPRPQ